MLWFFLGGLLRAAFLRLLCASVLSCFLLHRYEISQLLVLIEEQQIEQQGDDAQRHADVRHVEDREVDQSDVDERMANIIEGNIKKEQENFDFEKLVYSFAVDNTGTALSRSLSAEILYEPIPPLIFI